MVHSKNIKNFLLQIEESETIELKSSTNNLPKDFWPTYSAFCNTNGGTILLGIQEGHPYNTLLGVKNPSKIIQDLFDLLQNPSKVSKNLISGKDIKTIDIAPDITIVIVKIPPANHDQKPIYLNDHLDNTYIRIGTGDFKATTEQLKALIRNSKPISDNSTSNDISIDDLDMTSVLSFKERISIRYPNRNFEKYNTTDFLKTINAITVDNGNEIKVRKGTLLFFGKYLSIKKHYPSFFLDYINQSAIGERWIDRISTDELTDGEMNIYNFFNIVFEKLKALLSNKFNLDSNSFRSADNSFDIAIREALINCLAHADYEQSFPSLKIVAYPNWILFKNPGEMLVSVDQFKNGGDSRPRNEMIMTFFRYLGASERQGQGGPIIYKNAYENKYRPPEIKTNLEYTELKLWHVDIVDAHPELSEKEKLIFNCFFKNSPILKLKEIQNNTKLTEYAIRKNLSTLMDKNLIARDGVGKATQYYLIIDGKTEMVNQLHLMIDKIQNM